MSPPRLCILGCSSATTGELTLALDFASRLSRPLDRCAVVPSAVGRTFRDAGWRVCAYPSIGPRTALNRIREGLREFSPDILLIADLFLFYGMAGEFGGMLPAVVAEACPRAKLLGLDVYDWDRNRDAIDLFGRPAMMNFAARGFIPPAPVPPPSLGRLLPAPYLAPEHSTPGRGHYAMMADRGRPSAETRVTARVELGLPDGPLMLLTTSPWQHLAVDHPESARVARQFPALALRLIDHAVDWAGHGTLVHLGPAPWELPSDVVNLEYRHVSQLPPAEFARLLAATDVLVSANTIASSNIRAASLRIPVAMLHLGRAVAAPPAELHALATPQGAVDRFLADAAPSYACSVWPLGMHALLSRMMQANPFADLQVHLDALDGEAAVEGLARLLRERGARDECREKQELYFKALPALTDDADTALDAALAEAPGGSTAVRGRTRPDPIQAAWRAGMRFFLDPDFRTSLLARVPETVPGRGTAFEALWPACKGNSLCDEWRAQNILERLLEVKDLEGDIIECGTWQGGISVMLALLCRQLGLPKRVWMLDSFRGLPPPRPGIDLFHREGWCHAPRAAVEQLVDRTGVRDSVVIREGWFRDTLPGLGEARFCFAHLDGDLYESTVECLQHIVPRLAEGAVVVVDDYHDAGEGVKRAVDEHLAATGEELHAGAIPQVYFRKGRRGGKPGECSLAELRANAPYRRMLEEVERAAQADADALAGMGRFIA